MKKETMKQDYFISRFTAEIDNLKCVVFDILRYFELSEGALDEATLLELRVVLTELLVNAIKHGGKNSPDHQVKVVAGVTADGYALVVVEDDGDGYDTALVDRDDLRSLTIDQIENLSETGRGIFLVKNLCEDFMVNEKGNKVVINKKLTTV